MATKTAKTIDGADQYVTHSHRHRRPNAVKVKAFHGHWHKHDARDREDHEHIHDYQDEWPHPGAKAEDATNSAWLLERKRNKNGELIRE